MTLEQRVVVVTGGSAGIGPGIARAVGRAGARVAVWSRRPDVAATAVAALRSDGVEALPVACDVGIEADVDRAMHATLAAYQRVDAVIANAGGGTTRYGVCD